MTLDPAVLVVFAGSACAVLLSWLYFRRYAMVRPPVGVMNLADVAFVLGAIVVVPILYVVLPLWVVGGLLAVGVLSVVYFLWEPVLRARWGIWLVVAGVLGSDIGTRVAYGPTSHAFYAVNNLVILMVVVGVSNMWAQSGMRARDLAILAGALAAYDFIATAQLPLMAELVGRVAELPFSPLIGWPSKTPGMWAAIGLGDLLLASAFPLVMRKAFGHAAGLTALLASLAAVAGLFALALEGLFPVMVVLGPLMVAQYLFWLQRRGRERTTREYLQAEPRSRSAVGAA